MYLFVIYRKRSWFHKKRFAIPVSLGIILIIGAIILGAVLGTKNNIDTLRMILLFFFSQ